jgi:hypothetical protein
MPLRPAGLGQTLTTSWNSNATEDTDYTRCRLPYNGANGNGTHGVVIFFNSQGYGRMVGRCYMTLNISQNHSGYFDFYCSRYGGGVTNQTNTNWANVTFESSINGNANWNGFVWYNTNGNNWGNGTLNYKVESWGGGLTSGQYNYSHTTGYHNYTGDGVVPTNVPFGRVF